MRNDFYNSCPTSGIPQADNRHTKWYLPVKLACVPPQERHSVLGYCKIYKFLQFLVKKV